MGLVSHKVQEGGSRDLLVRAKNRMGNHEIGICSCLCTCSYLGKVGVGHYCKDSVCGLQMNPGLCPQALAWTQDPQIYSALAQGKMPFSA